MKVSENVDPGVASFHNAFSSIVQSYGMMLANQQMQIQLLKQQLASRDETIKRLVDANSTSISSPYAQAYAKGMAGNGGQEPSSVQGRPHAGAGRGEGSGSGPQPGDFLGSDPLEEVGSDQKRLERLGLLVEKPLL